jgi:hypothetical protein
VLTFEFKGSTVETMEAFVIACIRAGAAGEPYDEDDLANACYAILAVQLGYTADTLDDWERVCSRDHHFDLAIDGDGLQISIVFDDVEDGLEVSMHAR